jgi:hypothetical protein
LIQGIEHLKIGVSAIVNYQSYLRQHTHEYPETRFACAIDIVNRTGTLGEKDKDSSVPLLHTLF